ncbi:type II/IV secretion system ATPase subunit [Stetteria hydrogenophila]
MTWSLAGRLRRVLKPRRAGGPAGRVLQAPPVDVGEEADVVAAYRVGPVEYTLYRTGRIDYKLVVVEPLEPPPEALEEVIAGLREPETPGERYHAEKAVSGYGPIYPLIIDSNVEEIAFTDPSRPVMVIHRLVQDRWIETSVKLTPGEADALALSLARKAGRQLSMANPIAEGVTVEGHRVSVTFGREVSRGGSTFVVRKYPEKPFTMADLIRMGSITPLEAAYLWMLVEAQGFILIVGNMGSGKTTLLQALASLIPPGKRVITIEDAPELRLPVEAWDSLYTRPPLPGDEDLEVSLEDLVKFALRRRGDYIIVGEVRGREARLLAQAAALGHGTMATFHADNADSAVVRLSLDPISLPPLFLRSITAFVTVRRALTYDGRAVRRVAAITEVAGDELRDVFTWDPATGEVSPTTPSEVAGVSEKLRWAWERLGRPMGSPEAELEERARVLAEAAEAVERDGTPFRRVLVRFYEKRWIPQ